MSTDTQPLEALEADAKYILPVYIAVDRSWSMSKEENDAIDEANALIPAIIRTCIKNPLADERARFTVIGFNNKAEVVSPMARGSNLTHHEFVAEYGTSFTELFKVLRQQLEEDYVKLQADGYRVYRPAVFLITDGEPICDDRERASAFAALSDRDFPRRPNMSVFGLGPNVPEEVVKDYLIGDKDSDGRPKQNPPARAFITKDGFSAAEALGGFVALLMQSIVSSTANVAGGSSSEGDDGFVWDDDAIADEDFLLEIES